jgi:hypothetical protein
LFFVFGFELRLKMCEFCSVKNGVSYNLSF